MRRFLVAAFALGTISTGAQAQAACSNALAADACAVGQDLFLYMAPQLGTSLTGASHTLGVGTTLGGFPHFAIALRGNAVMGDLPQLTDINAGAAQQRTIDTKEQIIGLPTVDFALGLFKGVNLGVTRIGGIDLIGGVTYVPEIAEGDITIMPQDGSIAVGLGARVGLLEQSALIPGVAFSYMQRDLPTVDFGANSGTGDSFAINDFSVKTSSWRLSAQKNFLIFQLGAGYGSDTYDFSTNATVSVDNGAQTASFDAAQSMTRNTMYGSLGINLFLFKVVGEVGQVSGGNAPTFNDFAQAANKARTYGSLGIRISF
jgi:hypothetical protein